MKRILLKRKTPLTRATSLNKVSKKQEKELAHRRLLKYQLWSEQNGRCKECGKFLSYANEAADNYPHLSHKKPLSRGGKTARENCSVLCAECHSNQEHHLRNIYNER